MDADLLELFVDSLRLLIVGRRITACHWCKPVLSIRLGTSEGPKFLVAVLQPPGPFCFLWDKNPLHGVETPDLFGELYDTEISAVYRPENDRMIVFEAVEKGGAMVVSYKLSLFLYGSFGRAELTRNGILLHQIGASPRHPAARAAAYPARSWAPGRGEKFFLVSNGRPGGVKLTAIGDETAKYRFGPFDDLITGVREAGVAVLEAAYGRMIEERLRPAVRRIANRNSLLESLRDLFEKASGHEEARRQAETLAAYQTRVKPGSRTINLPDIYDPEKTVSFELDPSLPIQKQIEKRFKRAGKLQRSAGHTRRRIAEVESELKRLVSFIEAVRAAVDFASAMKALGRMPFAAAGRSGAAAPARKTADVDGGFRRFDLDPFWFVLVGRSNQDNDDLTFRRAAPTDLWFHAQHVPGSHAVLKSSRPSGPPPGRIIQAAASIAAYYSKAKHSSLVPVIYTQRKYVRKPRGAKPGQVVCEREKTVVVRPVLPDSGRRVPDADVE